MNTPTTPDFEDWFGGLSSYLQALVEARLLRIRDADHFGVVSNLGDGLMELKWKNGLRVYFAYISDADGKAALMPLGGGKNGQARDIAKARAVLNRATS